MLKGQGVEARVLDMHTVKPLDEAAVIAAAKETGRIVVAEEHLMAGGLGSAVATVICRNRPVPMAARASGVSVAAGALTPGARFRRQALPDASRSRLGP